MNPLDPRLGEVRPALFGGEGTVTVWNVGQSALVPPFTAAVFAELSPGGSVGKHQQATDDEVVIVVEGEGVLYLNGQARACVPGSLVGVPRGTILEIDNASPEMPLRYLIIKAR